MPGSLYYKIGHQVSKWLPLSANVTSILQRKRFFSGKYKKPPVDHQTFIELASLCSQDVITSTHDGFYRQINGLAMGSPPAPQLAHGWMSKFDDEIKGDARLYTRYMDDILRDIKNLQVDNKLIQIDSLHFTVEREIDSSIPFLDMRIHRKNGKLSSEWFTKPPYTPTDASSPT